MSEHHQKGRRGAIGKGAWDKARAARWVEGKTTTPEQLEVFFAELRANGSKVKPAAEKAGMSATMGYYYLRRSSDSNYAAKTKLPVEGRLWLMLERILESIEAKIESGTLVDLAKAAKELGGLHRTLAPPPAKVKVVTVKQEKKEPPRSAKDEVLSAIQAAEKKKAEAEASPPVGDIPTAQIPGEM